MENGSAAIGHKPPRACFSAQRTQTSVPGAASRGRVPFQSSFSRLEIFPQINVCHCLQFLQSWWESCWLEAQQSIPMFWGHTGAFQYSPWGSQGQGCHAEHPPQNHQGAIPGSCCSQLGCPSAAHGCAELGRAFSGINQEKEKGLKGSALDLLFQNSQTASRVSL